RIGKLRATQSAPPGAANQVAERTHELRERQAVHVVDRRRNQSTLADGDGDAEMNPLARLEAAIDPEAVEIRIIAECTGNRLEEEDAVENALRRRPLRVLRLEPAQGR